MKFKHAVPMIMLLVLGYSACAQETTGSTNRNEVRIGYGILTMPEMLNSLAATWSAIGISISMDSITDYSSSLHGVATLEYNRFVTKWLTVGGSLSVNPVNTVLKTKSDLLLTWSYYLFNIMPKVNVYYLNRDMIALYSGIEVGLSSIMWTDRQGNATQTDLGFSTAFHVNAFGIRIGKQIGGFMEWGFGFRGVVNLGLSARF